MRDVRIAVIPGDGIGKEVVPQGVRVLQAAADLHGGLRFTFEEQPWGCDYYRQHGVMMPDDGIETLSGFDQVFLGAVGHPDVPDHVSLWGLLIPIRREFQQYVNLRPVRLLEGVKSPHRARARRHRLRRSPREQRGRILEDGWAHPRGHAVRDRRPNRLLLAHGSRPRDAIRVELAENRARRLTVATKSNGVVHTMPFWDQIARQVGTEHPSVATELVLVDALAAYLVTRPDTFDVIVATNLQADILTDLGGAIMGSIGIAPPRTSTPPATIRRCSSRSTDRPRTLRVRGWPIRSDRSGPPSCSSTSSVSPTSAVAS